VQKEIRNPNLETQGQTATTKLGLSMPRVVAVYAFGQQSFASALTAPGKGCTSAFRPHPRTKAVLTFAGALRSL
jgi:hypothetical protein